MRYWISWASWEQLLARMRTRMRNLLMNTLLLTLIPRSQYLLLRNSSLLNERRSSASSRCCYARADNEGWVRTRSSRWRVSDRRTSMRSYSRANDALRGNTRSDTGLRWVMNMVCLHW